MDERTVRVKNKKILLLLFLFGTGLAFPEHAEEKNTAPKNVFSNGGAVLTDEHYRIMVTVGQPFISVTGTSSNEPRVGFWHVLTQRQYNVVDELSETLSELPAELHLLQNYPNPFNPVTVLKYDLPQRADVTLTIYDILGRQVRTLVSGIEEPGFRSVIWDATDDLGRHVGAGVYLYQIQAGDFTQTRKMLLLR